MRIYQALLILALVFSTSIVQAVTVHVPGDHPTIQAGIDACADGDTVMVADGTYTGTGNRDIDFTGKAIVVISEHGPEVTIIDCQGSESAPHRGFFFHNREGFGSVVQGFTITNGWAGKYPDGGGGVHNLGSSPTITDCIFTGNSADQGGGMYNNLSDPMISGCTFSDNSVTYYGGGIKNDDSNPTVVDCTFTGNISGTDGGGFCGGGSGTVVTDCMFDGNRSGWGGGMYIGASDMTVSNCWFVDNSADEGGGIATFSLPYYFPTITNCTFTGNSAEVNGGAMSNRYGCHPKVSRCVFTDNSATSGGAISNEGSSPTIANSTIRNNSAVSYGGGVYNFESGHATIVNCTLTDNSAYQGGGVYDLDWSDAIITNCILWDNLPGDIYYYNSNPTVTYCDVKSGFIGPGNMELPPRFADPELHLQSTSPCIDAGDPSMTDTCRPPGMGGERSDMGAYGGAENCGWPRDPVELIVDPVGPVLVTRDDTLYFNTLIRNNSQNNAEGDYWLSVEFPGSNEVVIPEAYLNYPNPISGQVAGTDSLVLSNALHVPENAPTGGYKLIGRVGIHPATVIDEWWLNFVVAE